MRYVKSVIVCSIFLPVILSAQCWQYTGSMNEVRWMSTLTVLPNNKVLAAGGIGQNDAAVSSCEIYDIATAKWREVAPMSVPREHLTATRIPDGRVVVIGGNMGSIYTYDASQYTTKIEIFDPASETWSDGGDLVVPRTDQVVELMPDSTILVIGGYNGSMLTECEVYNPKTKTSRVVGSMSTARIAHEAVVLSTGEILVAGGYAGPWEGPYYNSCEVYNPVTETWRTVDPMLETRSAGSLAKFSDGSILAAGGRGSSNSYATAADMLDPVKMTWSAVRPMKQEEAWQSGVMMPFDNYLITGGVSGGDFSSNNGGYSTPTCEWYDKTFGRWFYAPQMNLPRAKHTAVCIHQEINSDLPEDFILVVGGFVSQNSNGGPSATYTATAEILNVGIDELAAYRASPANLTSVDQPAGSPDNFAVIGNVGTSPYAVFSLERPEEVALDIVSSTGIVVSHIAKTSFDAGKHTVALDVRSLPNGAYFVSFTSSNQHSMAKLVVVR